MAGLKQRRNGIFYLTWYEGGARFSRSLKTKTRKIAEEKRRVFEMEIETRGTLRPSTITIGSLVEEYLRDADLRLQPPTVARSRQILGTFSERHAGTRAFELGFEAVHGFLGGLLDGGYKTATYNRYRATLSALFRFGVERGLIHESPLARIRSLPVDQRDDPPFLTEEELDLLLVEARDTYLEVPLALGAFAGLRKGEMERLEWEDVDFRQKLLRVCGSNRRRGRPFVMASAEGGPLRYNLRARLAVLPGHHDRPLRRPCEAGHSGPRSAPRGSGSRNGGAASGSPSPGSSSGRCAPGGTWSGSRRDRTPRSSPFAKRKKRHALKACRRRSK